MKAYSKLLSLVSITFCLIIFILFGMIKIDFSISDLGRHLTNGRLFLENHTIIRTNYYSYTEPDFPVVTHHWGSGIIFYLIYQIFGFNGISVFVSIISLLAFLFFYIVAIKRAGVSVASLIFISLLPLINVRTEPRPEIFSYLLAGFFYWILLKFKENKLSFKFLFFLPTFMIFWVNFHIYFFLGIVIIGAFLLEALILKRGRFGKYTLYLIFIFMLTHFAALINPFGFSGAVAPYKIFNNYGYKVLENQNVWYLEKIITNEPYFLIFKIMLVIFVLTYILGWYMRKEKLSLADLFLGGFFAVLSIMAIRNITIFALFALPIMAANISASFGKKILGKIQDMLSSTVAGFLIFIFLLTITGSLVKIFPKLAFFGIGLFPGENLSAEFFKKEGLKGPIFNNYDIGGYLIFHLFPKEKVFVDNRPEAYSVDFFQKVYIPMQNDEQVWKEMLRKYNFNTIYFQRWEQTEWSAQFLSRRINDPEWAPVFTDLYAIILVRRNKENAEVIKKFEIPKENFRLVPKNKH